MENKELYNIIRSYCEDNNFSFKDGRAKIINDDNHNLQKGGIVFFKKVNKWFFDGLIESTSTDKFITSSYMFIPYTILFNWYNRKEILNDLLEIK
jgi:hypothetical protein